MGAMNPIRWFLAVVLIAGCSETPQTTAPVRPAGEMLLSCVKESGPKLDAALANGDVRSAVREIVQSLDDHEDSPEPYPPRLCRNGPSASIQHWGPASAPAVKLKTSDDSADFNGGAESPR